MKQVEIIGYKRANLGKRDSKDLRLEANVPCVLYGGEEQLHFHVPMFLFRDIIYTGVACTVLLNLEGKQYKCILQEAQFHPVNEMLLHVDFLLLKDDKEVKMNIPLEFVGTSPGVVKGGKFIQKVKTLSVKALPKNLPDAIQVDISTLEIGKSVKVADIKTANYVILNAKAIPVASVVTTRALKQEESSAKK
ncbi:MAG: 50S ribosomal protein L25/general stress protein Ctc [Cytophagaceae bacterium]|jgi:large subunit ribosomal protein L25|nr:50S ribosomal protein L25/general stress protein Ctc [Cytophagaceae bacterium]